MRLALAVAALLLGCAAPAPAPSSAASELPYVWKNVAIGGGGFVSGLLFHPALPQLLYARTDMGGAYRRDADAGRWQPLLDWLPLADVNLMGVESMAVDPSDADKLYLACGTYTAAGAPAGAVLRSNDRGRSFSRTDLPVKFGANEEGRGNGERMAVDPHDGRVLYLGTRRDGLWRSTDGAAGFQPVHGFPADVRDPVVFVLFDPASGAPGAASRTLYVGVSVLGRPNLWRSQDGGANWAALPGAPTHYRPTRAAWGADGRLFVSYGSEAGPSVMPRWRPIPAMRAGCWPAPMAARAARSCSAASTAARPGARCWAPARASMRRARPM